MEVLGEMERSIGGHRSNRRQHRTSYQLVIEQLTTRDAVMESEAEGADSGRLEPAFVLAREGAGIDQVHPLQTTRWADDAEGASDLAVLLGILITAAQRRPSHGKQS